MASFRRLYRAIIEGFIEIVARIIFIDDFSEVAKNGFLEECASCDFPTFSASISAYFLKFTARRKKLHEDLATHPVSYKTVA